MTRIAVLGCGRIGAMHAANIAAHPRATLAGVYDIHRPAAEKTGARVYGSVEECLADESVDAVLIATATDTHADLLEACLAAGKPVLCEKPIDLRLARAKTCAERIKGSTLPVQLGFVRRFDPGHRALAQAVQAGKVGELHQVTITSRDPGLAPEAYLRASGGIFRDMTIHDFDMARYVLGEEVATVHAVGARLVDAALMETLQDWDTVTVILTTASGRQATILNSRRAVYGYDQRVEAFGSAGMAISENRRPHMMRLTGAQETDAAAPLQNFFIDRYREAFDAEIDAFVTCVEQGTAAEVGFHDGLMSLAIAEAATLSARESRTVAMTEVL
jgi:myo-inositol 2-dehydrogenase/D-chiro-inositol 1-dehydrogenase